MLEKKEDSVDANLYKIFNDYFYLDTLVDIEIIEFLLSKKANPNGELEDGGSFLVHAVSKEQPNLTLINLLLHYGANPNYCHNGQFCLDFTYESTHIEVRKLLIKKGAKPVGNHSLNQKLRLACREDLLNYNAIKSLLDEGAHPNTINNWGQCSLMFLALHQSVDLEIIKLLIEYGANPNICDEDDSDCLKTLLYKHVYKDEIIQYLITQGANVNAIKDGSTSFERYCSARANSLNINVIKSFLNNGAELSPGSMFFNVLSCCVDNNESALALFLLLKYHDCKYTDRIKHYKYQPNEHAVYKLILLFQQLETNSEHQTLMDKLAEKVKISFFQNKEPSSLNTSIQESFLPLMLSLKRLKSQNSLFPVPPKFVTYEIIKKCFETAQFCVSNQAMDFAIYEVLKDYPMESYTIKRD